MENGENKLVGLTDEEKAKQTATKLGKDPFEDLKHSADYLGVSLELDYHGEDAAKKAGKIVADHLANTIWGPKPETKPTVPTTTPTDTGKK